jgi:hypothetical protein
MTPAPTTAPANATALQNTPANPNSTLLIAAPVDVAPPAVELKPGAVTASSQFQELSVNW